MNIDFINEINHETKTLNKLVINNESYCLSDEQVVALLEKIKLVRSDLFDDLKKLGKGYGW